ncbi:MAG TPA: hypothetical protein VFM34_08015 [Moraxellaceae bacterium]|nr:hypothetical protein [Moraxellaceae bacterium]
MRLHTPSLLKAGAGLILAVVMILAWALALPGRPFAVAMHARGAVATDDVKAAVPARLD